MIYNAHHQKTDANSAKPDGRGKSSGSSRLLSGDIKKGIIDHISLFPAVESHYCRQNTQKKYLDSFLNVSKMYSLYTDLCKANDIQPAKQSTYRWVFNTEFNIGFHVPKSDRCDLCEAFTNCKKHNLAIAESQMSEYDMHIANKDSMRKERDADKKGNIPILSFDLQNVINCPRAEISSFFYRRKLNIYNLTAKLSLTNQVYCAIWNESLSGRAGNDIASALRKILDCVVDENVLTELTLWSDSCVPQNRNSHMSKCLMEFMQDHKDMDQIFMKFSVPGHSCIQEIDHVHSCIEKAMRSTEIYSPVGLIRLLKLVNRKQPYKIIQMQATDFRDYSTASKLFNYKEVPFSKVSTLRFTQSLPEIQYKLCHRETALLTVNIRLSERAHRNSKGKEDNNTSVFITSRSKVVTIKPVLSAEKIKDFKLMLKFMAPQDSDFYKATFNII